MVVAVADSGDTWMRIMWCTVTLALTSDVLTLMFNRFPGGAGGGGRGGDGGAGP
jgi:hypothetical protein